MRIDMSPNDIFGDFKIRLGLFIDVRGFTKDESSGVKYRGTYAGLAEKIPYLKELGITALELLPIFEFDEFEGAREIEGNKLLNYWGYSTVGFFRT